jgi:hypothetical protein
MPIKNRIGVFSESATWTIAAAEDLYRINLRSPSHFVAFKRRFTELNLDIKQVNVDIEQMLISI